MIVARQFIAWYSRENRNRPVERLGPIGVLRSRRLIDPRSGSDRALRDGFSIERVPARKLSGPAAIILSLRDKARQVPT
jgi:hypothetical protein